MNQTCILILGMHRSGTSALTGVLNLLDVNLGSKLVGNNKSNEKGHFENQHFLDINKKFIEQIDCSWDDTFYCESKLNKIKDTSDIEAIIKQEFGHCTLFAIKDPRLVFLFPLYKRTLSSMGINVKIIIPFRHPSEVALSLKSRNKFCLEKSYLLWANHYLSAEKLSRDLPRVFTCFDELLKSPQIPIKQLDEKLKLDLYSKYTCKKNQIQNFLQLDLKHHNFQSGTFSKKVPKLVENIMNLMIQNEESKSLIQFDVLRQQFCDYQNIFYNKDVLEKIQITENLNQQLKTKRRQLKTKDQHLMQISHKLSALESSKFWKIYRILQKVKSLFSR